MQAIQKAYLIQVWIWEHRDKKHASMPHRAPLLVSLSSVHFSHPQFLLTFHQTRKWKDIFFKGHQHRTMTFASSWRLLASEPSCGAMFSIDNLLYPGLYHRGSFPSYLQCHITRWFKNERVSIPSMKSIANSSART